MLILILTGYVLLALFLFNLIGLLFILPFFDYSFELTLQALSNPMTFENAKMPLLILQGVTALGAFVLAPWFFSKVYLKTDLSDYFKISEGRPQAILLSLVIMLCFIVVNSVFIEWNMSLELPEFLSWFENWARKKEDELGELTQYLTQFDNFGQFLMGVFVIAVLAAVGEELLFRGLFQNLFFKSTGNPHAAIWITAFLFGTFHMQFYGILPRMLLGALFGYLYYWSGYLSYAMIGHFANNFFMLVMVYLYHQEVIEFDIETTEVSPDLWIVMIFTFLTSVLLVNFYRLFNSPR